MKDLRHLQQKSSGIATQSYRGIPMFCAKDIHEKIFAAFEQLGKKKDCAILVLGSGPGAFEARLLDHGYTNITSVEFVAENFSVKGTKFFSRDLNRDFTDLGTFDAIFAIELIEHLENQFHFVRNVATMMRPDAAFYLSSPNAESSFSRMKYGLTRRLQYFGPGELAGTGHITPIFSHILAFNLEQSGLVIRKQFTNTNLWSTLLAYPNIAVRTGYFFLYLLHFCLPRKNDNEINLFEIVKKDPR
ncbi:MAG: methyltransferase domain-containing protein [Patescibacteria group bacterium]|nr:class I SAM-dependent methyltransferase [Patescibacteria group bacterium]MDE1946108.1 methyltransferase domain-containing protein [Patescibacteria group bacterium]